MMSHSIAINSSKDKDIQMTSRQNSGMLSIFYTTYQVNNAFTFTSQPIFNKYDRELGAN